eukprot:scaffold26508_cov29-Cyclotella_meneghiniana.AAC.1
MISIMHEIRRRSVLKMLQAGMWQVARRANITESESRKEQFHANSNLQLFYANEIPIPSVMIMRIYDENLGHYCWKSGKVVGTEIQL